MICMWFRVSPADYRHHLVSSRIIVAIELTPVPSLARMDVRQRGGPQWGSDNSQDDQLVCAQPAEKAFIGSTVASANPVSHEKHQQGHGDDQGNDVSDQPAHARILFLARSGVYSDSQCRVPSWPPFRLRRTVVLRKYWIRDELTPLGDLHRAVA